MERGGSHGDNEVSEFVVNLNNGEEQQSEL